ncbi:hypothetical protein [Crocosphaera sp.]|uniref:hypothetical protein n=1 Tax=Crocosphaera sp. TaxID=2729996 RepID=UPI002626145F|nr:hypothetical protein [Crocosphaera sp.]MDJ0579589.1 hypothetical protein [Crocosphaera sp.]
MLISQVKIIAHQAAIIHKLGKNAIAYFRWPMISLFYIERVGSGNGLIYLI